MTDYEPQHADPVDLAEASSARMLTIAMTGLLVVLVMCLSGIIYLAAAVPARAIPDILVGTTTLIVGTIAGILVPRPRR